MYPTKHTIANLRHLAIALTASAGLLACSGDAPDMETTAAFLPVRLDSAAADRASETRRFVGDSLWEYINGDAEIYHAYSFEEAATADYRAGSMEFVVDIYRFADHIMAYGLYTSVRPDGADELDLGAAAFASETALDFVKGRYLVRLTAYRSEPGSGSTLRAAASVIEPRIPGAPVRPPLFRMFPDDEERLSACDHYHASSFLGRAYLTNVYTQAYAVDGDTLVLFLSDDPERKLSDWARDHPSDSPPPEVSELPFDPGSLIWAAESFHGPVVVGKVGKHLAGVINFGSGSGTWLADWLRTLAAGSAD